VSSNVDVELLLYKDHEVAFRYPSFLRIERFERLYPPEPKLEFACSQRRARDKYASLHFQLFRPGSEMAEHMRQDLLRPLSAEARQSSRSKGIEYVNEGVSSDITDAVERIEELSVRNVYSILMLLRRKNAEIQVGIQGDGKLSDWRGCWLEVISSIEPLAGVEEYFARPLVEYTPPEPKIKGRKTNNELVLKTIKQLPEEFVFLAPAILDLGSQVLADPADCDLNVFEKVLLEHMKQFPPNERDKRLAALSESFNQWTEDFEDNEKLQGFHMASGALLGYSFSGEDFAANNSRPEPRG